MVVTLIAAFVLPTLICIAVIDTVRLARLWAKRR